MTTTMMMVMVPLSLLLLVMSTSCVVVEADREYVSASTVASVYSRNTLSSVTPTVQVCPGMACNSYLDPNSCLGYLGPISAYGPLGMLGPFVNNQDFFDFSKNWASQLSAAQHNAMTIGNLDPSALWGLLCGAGKTTVSAILGPDGPLGTAFISYMQSSVGMNDFAVHLNALGLWTVLGPLGPLGPLGGLGPLGPLGGLSYQPDSNGRYVDSNNQIVRTLSVPYQSASRVFPLFESYSESYAAKLNYIDNDCSWAITGTGLSLGETRGYKFSADATQFVTVVLIPQYQLDSYILTIEDDTKHILASSKQDEQMGYINWVQLKVTKGQKLRAVVKFSTTSVPLWVHNFYLHVVGSTQYFQTSPITGPHISYY